jgi:hypothetical protein
VTSVSITGIPTANAQLQSLIERIAIVNGKLVTLQVAANAANVREDRTAIPARAKGGPVEKGQPYLVGENQPEIFVPNESGQIIPDIGLLRRGVNAGSGGIGGAGQAAPQQVRSIVINGGITLAVSGVLDMMSDIDQRKIVGQLRDKIVQLEGAQR